MNPNTLRNSLLFIALILLPAAARATADVTPPVLVSFAFAPGSVDVTSTSQNFGVTAHATDDMSGVSSVYGNFVSPSGKHSISFYMTSYNLVSGNPLDGVYSSTALISQCAEPGTWKLQYLSVYDECGNNTSYAATPSGSTLAFPAGTQTTLTVINPNPDTSAPVLVSFTFSPSTVDLSSSGAKVTVTAEISDTTTGVSSGYFSFTSPSGNQTAGGSFSSFNLSSGDQFDGTYQTTVSFSPGCDEAGNWKLSYVSASDNCEQSVNYSSTGLAFPNGMPTTLTVMDPNADSTAPALVSLMLSATTADVTNGPVNITGTAVATDNASGISSAYGIYFSPSNKNTVSVGFGSYSLLGGTLLDGTFTATGEVTACSEPGAYTLGSLTVYDACENAVQYGGKNKPFPQGVPTALLVTNGTIPTASLTVNILPSAAEYLGSWNVDGGTTEYTGVTVGGLAPGMHTLNFLSAFGFITPPSQSLMLAANQSAFATGTYVSMTSSDSVQVNIIPAGAVTAGAEWNVDNGPLQSSGATVSGLADGAHTINFSDVSGYTAPASQVVMTASNMTTVTTGSYAVVTQQGSIKVTLSPQAAINAGAKWNIDGGSSQNSGDTTNVLIGNHEINFAAVTGFTAPASQSVLVTANTTTSTTGTYTAIVQNVGSIKVDITPAAAVAAGAQWNLDGAASQPSGRTLGSISTGSHTVNFTMANGYVAPPSQNVTIVTNQTLVTTGTYTKAPGFTGAAASFAGVSPDGSDLLTLSLKATGNFTGKLATANAGSFALAGIFNSSGYFAGKAGTKKVPYVLQITGTSPSTYVLTGSASGVQITAAPAAYAKGVTPPQAGKYTALLSNSDTSIGIPQGTGYATVTVAAGGVASLTGKLADGTGFTASGMLVSVTGDNELLVFDPNIYAKKGLLTGTLIFDTPAAGQFTGTLAWKKPARRSPYYPALFNTTLEAAGALYTPMPFTSGTETFSGGGLGATVMQPYTVAQTGAVTVGTPNPDKVKLAIKDSKGTVGGSFEPVGAKKPIGYSGMVLQQPGNLHAGGFFLGPVVSGTGLSGKVTLP